MRKTVLLPAIVVLLLGILLCALSAYSKERPFAGLTAQEQKWLDDNRGAIVLTYEADFPPLEFRDKEGKYTGLSADIIARIEKLLGITFQKVPSFNWVEQLASLEEGSTHLCAVIERTPERESFAYFTAPYISVPLVFITTTRAFPGTVTWSDLAGRRVAVGAGFSFEKQVADRGKDHFEVVPVLDVRAGLRDVSFGVVDVFVDNLASASYYIEQDGLTNLRVAGLTGITSHSSIGISRKYPLLYSAVQKALAEISDEDIEVSRKRWISLSSEGMLSPEALRFIKLVGVFTVLLLLGLGAISYYLKRRLSEKMESLRQAQQELQEQTERLGLATEATNAGVWDFYPATGQAYFSDQWYAMLGLAPGAVEATFAGWFGLLHPEDRTSTDQTLRGYIDSGGLGLFEAEYRMRQTDGSYRWVLGKGRAIAWDDDGSPKRLVGLNLDIQKIKDVQEELRRSEALAKAAFDQTFQFSGLLDLDGNVLDINKSALSFIEARREDVLGRPFWDCPWWPDHKQAEASLRRDMATALNGGLVRREVVNNDAQGNPTAVDFSLSPLTGQGGQVTQFIVEGRDITESRRLENQLRENVETLEKIFNGSPDPALIIEGGRFVDCNNAAVSILGYARKEDLLNTHPGALSPELQEDGEPSMTKAERMMATAVEKGINRFEWIHKRADGSLFPVEVTLSPVHIRGKEVLYTNWRDITEQRAALQALRASEEKYRAIFTNSPMGIFRSNFHGGVLEANPALARMHGYASVQDFLAGVTDLGRQLYQQPEDRQRLLDALLATPSGARMSVDFLRLDGTVFQAIINAALHMDENGQPTFIDGTIEDITERKRAEQALRESEERYRSVIQNMQDVYFRSDAAGRLIMVSPSGLKLFGYDSVNEVLGQLTESFYMIPAERKALLAKLAAEGVIKDYELLLKRKDGTPVQAATTASFYRDAAGNVLGVEGIFRDITERKQAEERLRQSEEKFSRIFEMAPECISFVRLSDSVRIDANAAFEKTTGYPRKEAIGRDVTKLTIWDDLRERDKFIAKLLAEGHVNDFEFRLRRKDGVLRRVVSSAQLVSIAGEQCYVNIIHDITNERRMQELLIQSEKMMSVGSLAAGIAHEINNPLGIVHQAVQNLILRTSPDQKKNQEAAASLDLPMEKLQAYLKARKLDVFLEDIQSAALRASGIIRNMLNFSRRSESKRQTCDLNRIIEQSVFLASSDYDLKKSYDFKRIEISLDLAEDLPECSCTETEIEQVLLNLLRNAAQAMAMANPPTPNPRIDIRMRPGEDCVHIEVADNGPGIDPDTQRKVFEPFFTTKPPGVGTGLGLSVSYFIITKGHGGKMWMTSSPGKGTTFFIELPADSGEADHG
ncbi:PAS domain S-box protein [Humidesulfovibrio sp.]|uniref:PAS domain S-box protein n=1 Tax=Humidesulfovibrio sp. TaxID=2910988 RepID=UPI00280B6FDB|nr:PAS domain S-box protein [Humidesulfovibrio sp.]